MDPTRTTYLRHQLGNENIPSPAVPHSPETPFRQHPQSILQNPPSPERYSKPPTSDTANTYLLTHNQRPPLITTCEAPSPPFPLMPHDDLARYIPPSHNAPTTCNRPAQPPSHLHQIVQYLHETSTMHTRYVVVSPLKIEHSPSPAVE